MADERVFGEIPGIAIGTSFINRVELAAASVHRPTQAGISGSGKEGADSIVVSGGYEDDQDFGDEIIYTGHGGRDQKTGKHIEDQKMERGNLALVVNENQGLPVRVIRGADRKNAFSPEHGYRYDGMYRVESHWHEKGKAGFLVWRYRLLKLDDDYKTPKRTGVTPTLNSSGGNKEPSRRTTTVQRVIRDTKQSRNLKEFYDYACQVCGLQMRTSGGFYGEAAHIRPLGVPHNGPDTQDNIICLCPNHHVMFDKGAFSIADDFSLIGIAGNLKVKHGHRIDSDHLKYHREHYLNLNTSKEEQV